MALSNAQRAAAEILLAARPPVIPGTRVIISDVQKREWYTKVTDAMRITHIKNAQIDEFCNVAGVPD